MAEKNPEQTTQSIRRQYNTALEETKNIIDADIKQLRITAISLQYRELLSLCDIIDRLTHENATLKELLRQSLPIIYNTYRSDDLGPKSLPCRIEQALKGE